MKNNRGESGCGAFSSLSSYGAPSTSYNNQSSMLSDLLPSSCSFHNVVKVNKRGKKQERTFTVSANGIANKDGKTGKIKWHYAPHNILSIRRSRIPTDKGHQIENGEVYENQEVLLDVLQTYTFICRNEDEAKDIVSAASAVGMGLTPLVIGLRDRLHLRLKEINREMADVRNECNIIENQMKQMTRGKSVRNSDENRILPTESNDDDEGESCDYGIVDSEDEDEDEENVDESLNEQQIEIMQEMINTIQQQQQLQMQQQRFKQFHHENSFKQSQSVPSDLSHQLLGVPAAMARTYHGLDEQIRGDNTTSLEIVQKHTTNSNLIQISTPPKSSPTRDAKILEQQSHDKQMISLPRPPPPPPEALRRLVT